MNRKWQYLGGTIVVVMSIVTAVLVLISGDWTQNGTTNAVEEKTVTMLIRESNDSLGLNRMIKKLYVDEKIRIDLQVVPDNQVDSLIRMKVNTGEIPDIVDYDVPDAYGLINPELYLEDLTGQEWVERVKSTEYIEHTNGNIYAFPMQESSGLGGVIYNREVFQKLGLNIPTTEKEFHDVCEKILNANITPILMSSDFSIPKLWMEYGIPLALGSDEKATTAFENIIKQETKLSDYEVIAETMNEYLQLFEKGYVNSDFQTIKYKELCQRLSDGNGAMIMGNFNHVSDVEYLNQEVNLGMFPVPFSYNEQGAYITTAVSKGFVVFKNGKNTEVAKEVLNLWSNPDYLELWYMDFGGIPAFVDVEYSAMNPELLALYENYKEEHAKINELTRYALPLYDLITTKFWLYYIEGPMNGETGMDILNKCESDVYEYLK